MIGMLVWALTVLVAAGQFAQSNTGELHVIVTDTGGLPLVGAVELVSESNHVHQRLETNSAGLLVAKRLPFGRYRVLVERPGFEPYAALIEIRSALPLEHRVTMSLAALQTQVTVSANETLLDLRRATAAQRLGADTLAERPIALPGRALPDIVNTQPGWLLEANGILHPRGSEYQTQYVVDGLPLTENRSPAFASELGADDVRAMTVMTGGYPAEYGRKLGGVIEVVTTNQPRRGFGGSLSTSAGSFSTGSGDGLIQYGWSKGSIGGSVAGATTDRYLDPPVEENFTNHGTSRSVSLRAEQDLSPANRLGAILRNAGAGFLVPNERIQQDAGQRQDRTTDESAAQVSWQRILTPSSVFDLRGMVRRGSAALWSNEDATPMNAAQDRGFREMYVKSAVTINAGAHELKAGGELSAGPVRERFAYHITDPTQFDPSTPPSFLFSDRREGHEVAAFVQDQIRAGDWTVNAGLRWDGYALVVHDRALSPRLAVAWSSPAHDLVLRATYDRVFQTPAFENLLLASSEAAGTLGDEVLRLPVPPSRGNFYEAGLSKLLFGGLRLDGSWFVRHMTDVADDDLLLNTGVSFPIAFREASIKGAEVKVDVPSWRNVTASAGYSFMRGVGALPITGGLFLGDEAAALLSSTERFAVTQDQRHTLRSRVSYRLSPSLWIAVAHAYGSGLPFEDFDGDVDEAIEAFGERVVSRVSFETGRVRPSSSLDASAGAILAKSRHRELRLQADVRNLTNRLDVINFAGLFSGTAVAPSRAFSVGLRFQFQ
jgi:hypothetical protein